MILLPINDDLYGLGEFVHNQFDSLCYTISSNISSLKYLDEKNIKLSEVNDYHLKSIGELNNIDFIGFGYAYRIQVPNKSTSASPLALSNIKNLNNLGNLFGALPDIVNKGMNFQNQSNLARESGSFLLLTYFFYDVKNGKRNYVYQNTIIKRLG